LQDLPENRIELSVITPVYKAEECLEELYRRLVAVLERTGEPFEIVMVNDGSPDDSWRLIRELASRDARVKGINLSRNFGQHNAITAGLDHCRGRFVVVMDCDLQHVPEDISRLYAKALRRSMKLKPEQLPIDIAEVGNTTSASIPILIRRLADAGRISSGMRCVLAGFGVGYSWAMTYVSIP
jgi:glycosyltransferase involved in cell wall biosynthesis